MERPPRVDPRARGPPVDVDQVLATFGGKREQAVRAYQAMLRQQRDEPWLSDRLERLPWWRGEPAEERPVRGVDALGRSGSVTRRTLAPGDFLERVCPLLGLAVHEVASAKREARLVEARGLIGALAVERWGLGVEALAVALGESRDGVSLWVRRAARHRSEDEAFARRLDRLNRRLAASLRG